MNRSDFLIRALNYYKRVGFHGYICIGDSSNEQHAEKIMRAVEDCGDRLNIIYRNFPEPPYNIITIQYELIELAPTPYVVFAGDDDFLIPGRLEQCVDFLKQNPDYSAASGMRITFNVKSNGVYGQMSKIRYARHLTLESESATERWTELMQNIISTQFYVHHKETWRRMYRDISAVPSIDLGAQTMPVSLSVILGKIKQLDFLSAVMQDHDKKIQYTTGRNFYSYINNPDWPQSVQGMRKSIVEALVEQDGIDTDAACKIFDKEFWQLIILYLQDDYNRFYGEPLKQDRLLDTLTKILGLKALVRLIRFCHQIASGHGKLYSLKLNSMLKPSSPYYSDFMPVYNTITKSPDEYAKSDEKIDL